MGCEAVHLADVAVTLQGPSAHLAALAGRLEDAGVRSMWTGDYFQSGLVRTAVLAGATRHASVGTHVLQAFARSPLATVLAAQELQDLSGGRFVLGLGSQFPTANRRWHGASIERPVAALGEYIAAVRTLLRASADTTIQFDGEHFSYRVPPFRHQASAPTPIWVGGAGMGTVRLAARTADGLAGHLLWTYRRVRDVVRPALADPSMPVTVARLVATGAEGRAAANRRLAHYLVTPGYRDLLDTQGTSIDQTLLRTALHSDDLETIGELLEPYVGEWSIVDLADLERHRERAAAHGVGQLMLLVPADPRDPMQTTRYENDLADLLERTNLDTTG